MERWTDVGPLLKAACADLKVGELLAGQAFSLFEAMSALEAGNPKMDAAASPTVERPTLEALLADPKVAPWDLPAPTLLVVLDQLLAMEASWHTGGSAMQTVYACLYMLKLDGAQEHTSPAARALYAYCRTLQYDCALVRDVVMGGAVCEEEDINVFTGGIPFEPPHNGAAATLSALEAAIASATAATATSTPSGGSSSSSTANGTESVTAARGSGDDAGAGPLLGEAVALRLRLRRALHLGLQKAAAHDPKEIADAAPLLEEARSLIERIRAERSAAPSASSSSSASSAPAAAAAAEPATSSSAASPTASSSGSPLELPLGFQIDVNRHLLGPAPPRQVKILSVSEALSHLDRMAEHLLVAVSVSEHVHDYRSLQLFLWRFARMRPGAVARSVMHSLILPERWQQQQQAQQEPALSSSSSAAAGQGEGQEGQAAESEHASQNGGGAAAAPSQQQRPVGAGRGGGGRKGGGGGKKGGGGGGGLQKQKQQKQTAQSTPAWVPSKEMIAGACRVHYKAGLPEEADLFFEQALIASANVFQAMLMNRCRSRRRLRRCLDDWLNMYHHGYNADVVPAFKEYLRATGWKWRPLDGQAPDDEQGPLSTWVECQTALTMIHHLLLGFELELYEPLEFDMIYWYCDYLCTCAVGAFTAILQRCPPPQPPKSQSQAPPGGGAGLGRGLGGKGRGGAAGANGRDPGPAAAAAAAALVKYEREQTQLRYEVLEVEAQQQLCQGMLRLMAGLRLAGSVPEHHGPPPFNTGAQRFEQRFASFAPLIRPPPLAYSDYLTSMDTGGRDAPYLMALAGASFKEARLRAAALKTFAPTPDVANGWVRGLERVAATNMIVAGVLGAKLADGGKVKWDCDWSLHPYFPAVSLPKPSAPAASATPATPAAATSAPTAAATPTATSDSGPGTGQST